MADARLQQLRRSISSWSLSTVKKPKINLPKLKSPKLKIFSGRKKNRVEAKDDSAATDAVKAALLNAEGEDAQQDNATSCEAEGQVIHEPPGKRGEDQPTIVLTVHDHPAEPGPPSPPPSPGLLDPNDDIEYIDSDDGEKEESRAPRRNGADVDYSDQWYDARGTLTRSREDLSRINDDYEECRASTYYDAADGPGTPLGQNKKVSSPEPKVAKGSQKAKEWVQSFTEDTERRVRRWMEMQKEKDPSAAAKSKSEIRLDKLDDEPSGKWADRNEIQLNAAEEEAYEEYLRKNASVDLAEEKSERNEVARRESMKKIFQVRGKLSIKPIIDSQRPKYTDTDIYIASTPYALTNPKGPQDRKLLPGESLDVSDDGIHCASLDLDPAVELSGDSIKTLKNFEDPKENDDKKLKLEVGSRPENIPDIIIDSPEVEEHQKDLTILGSLNAATDLTTNLDESSVLEQSTDVGEDSTLQDVTWTEDSVATDKDKTMHLEFQMETAETMFEEVNLNESITTEGESPANCKKPERKKRKIPGSNISKSIKNFAGSLFNQEANSENDSEKKKKRGSPFSKDHLMKTSSKEKKSEVKEKSPAKESLPDVLPASETVTPGPGKTHGLSAESLEYISPIESDEQKSVSSRSSDIGNPFHDDGELILRKEALLAIKAQENDDTSTHYYSFLTADDGYLPNSREASSSSPENVVPEIPSVPNSAKRDSSLSKNAATTPILAPSHDNYRVRTDAQQTPEISQSSSSAAQTPRPSQLSQVEDKTLKAPQGDTQPPKPSPRTKKGRYGYSAGVSTPPTPSTPEKPTIVSQEITKKEAPTPKNVQANSSSSFGNPEPEEKSFMATFPRRKSRQAVMSEPERMSSDSGYAGPGSTYYSGNEEPLYWEISETKGAPPRPSPRARKGRRAPSEPALNIATPPKKPEPLPVASPRKDPPDWIQVRAPIPSPRKKQRSLQSLPSVVPSDDSMETVKKKNFK